MELAFEDVVHCHVLFFQFVFQSFLSWNWPLKEHSTFCQSTSPVVSILLIVELAFEEFNMIYHDCVGGSFNPSYRGIGLWSRANYETAISLMSEFQSFLSWNWPLKPAKTIACIILQEFQSFLSWNWPLKQAKSAWGGEKKDVSILLIVELAFEAERSVLREQKADGFQSFLSWNWPLKTAFGPCYRSTKWVSILLIVELAFEVKKRQSLFWNQWCFNPSYRGIGLWRRLIKSWSSTKAYVSILLIVELAFEDTRPRCVARSD